MKKKLRQELLNKRQSLTVKDVVEKSDNIHKQLLQLKYYQEAKTMMVYVDFNQEAATRAIITTALNQGKRVMIPVCQPAGRQLIPSEVYHFPDDLEPGTWGILEPKPGHLRPVEATEIELILAPGVGFDLQGNRLGYGGGYYDRFLAKTAPNTVFMALAYELQLVADVFPAEHDIPVHYILTEDRLIDCQQHYLEGGKK